ncbi:MAG: hypothetical protein EHM72_03305 [Calditrichaeota bacterium]|nr:MAG: hypothetical protein EHM72_03305 [Calditrichota bacterium]
MTLNTEPVSGQYVELNGEKYYQIANYDQMAPFFISLVSSSDHWMFISSNGACTAGRKNPDNALFPYYTDDKIHDQLDISGGKAIIYVQNGEKRFLWEPFSPHHSGLYRVQKNLYKNVYGNKLLFEEINLDLGIVFRTAWLTSEKFGFIRHSLISNFGKKPVTINLLDGIQNILPAGIERRFQMEYSTLADGYKKNELQPDSGLALYSLSSIPVDKAEPSESLKATVVWSAGLRKSNKLISSRQLSLFERGQSISQETDVRAQRGAYFINAVFDLECHGEKQWIIAADVNQDRAQVIAIEKMLRAGKTLLPQVLKDVADGTEHLVKIIANADGLQKTNDELYASRHFSNVLFNVMRGGIFDQNYLIEKADLLSFINQANKFAARQQDFFAALPEKFYHSELLEKAEGQNDRALEKLCYEYLPLTFSRRHGDPSRPWNIFSIDIKDAHGGKILNYQGNWRDIFQNWEALATSFPDYVESMICKFVNASTADGYNPYRVTRDGFDWEVLDPHDPWSYIGYWGDHQIIYLLKLLELSSLYHPQKIQEFLGRDIFAYANVPYRIKPYDELLKHPHNTIDFDLDLQRKIEKRVSEMGTDGKFHYFDDGSIIFVNLTEKLLVTLLAKLANFVPEAGIWMNTQRPEWNDANNALVGYGVSMVTLYYLRRFVTFCRDLFESAGEHSILISAEVGAQFAATFDIFKSNIKLFSRPLTDRERKKILDQLGHAAGEYRARVYRDGFSGERVEISFYKLIDFHHLALHIIDHSIRANERPDHLYHAYNLMRVDGDGVVIRRLYEMLEGQAAVLSSGFLSSEQSLQVLDSLASSALYRRDQNSYILYPNRRLPRFVEKNNIPAGEAAQSKLLQKLAKIGDRRIIVQDIDGGLHFNATFRNAAMLKKALKQLPEHDLAKMVQAEMKTILEIYERMFDHQSFTGRSGTFYKYEGLGSIYWHMVSKLQLAVQETTERAVNDGQPATLLKRLFSHYDKIRDGIGVHKSPALYGAFPTDPYSHTPGHCGAQQPGMTGQVKEDILTRSCELGVAVRNGEVVFQPHWLQRREFLQVDHEFIYYDQAQTRQCLSLGKGKLAFTLCQTPIVYHLSPKAKIQVTKKNGHIVEIKGLSLGRELSRSIFTRSCEIGRIDVWLSPGRR